MMSCRHIDYLTVAAMVHNVAILMVVLVLRDRMPEIDYLPNHPLGASADDDNDDFLVPLPIRLADLADSWTLVPPPP